MSPLPLGILALSGAVGGGAYELIESQVLASSAASVTFSSIPQDYKHLQIRVVGSQSTSVDSQSTLTIRFNGDSGANYTRHQLAGNGSAVTSGSATGRTSIGVYPNGGQVGHWSVQIIDILDYTSTSKNKTTRALSGNATSGGYAWLELTSGLWINTSAISSMTLGASNFIAGSRFSLYGIRG